MPHSTISTLPKHLDYLDLATSQPKVKQCSHQFSISQVPLSNNTTINALDLAEISDTNKKKLTPEAHIKRATTMDQKAKDNGIELAKKNFFKALFSVALGGVGLGLSIAATALTGGAGVPVLAASGIAFTLVVADAACAFSDWQSKAGDGDCLKMGSDALANAVYNMLNKMGIDDNNAQDWASTTSVVLKTVLTVSTLWCGATASASVPGAIGSTLSMINLGKGTISSLGGMGLGLGITNIENERSKLTTEMRNTSLFDIHLDRVKVKAKLDLLKQQIHEMAQSGQISHQVEKALLLQATT